MTIDLDALELRAMRFHKLNPLHECFDSTTVLALIAEIRSVTETGRRILVSATAQAEALRAELRQERERADEAANHAELALAGRRNAVDALAQEQERAELFKREQVRLAHRCDAAQDALSRAEETIENALRAAPKLGELRWRNVDKMTGILRRYDDQKGADRG